MAKRLYVGNLGFEVTEDDLRELFGTIGEVTEAQIGLGAGYGKARGFGYVAMAKDEDADLAIARLHGHVLRGRQINVKEPKEFTPMRRFGRPAAHTPSH
jgi:RNA recognition motif-containing protein